MKQTSMILFVQGAGKRPGAPRYCGKSGCVETFLSGAGLARDYRSPTGKRLTPKKIAVAGAGGDKYARECLTVYQDHLAVASRLSLTCWTPM
jgi:fructokinase